MQYQGTAGFALPDCDKLIFPTGSGDPAPWEGKLKSMESVLRQGLPEWRSWIVRSLKLAK